MKAEALLPHTDALPRSTVEIVRHGAKFLVRYRRPDGTTWRQLFADRDEADRVFNEYVADLESVSKRV